jgi:dTDP-4-dehydrorhamnose reductase
MTIDKAMEIEIQQSITAVEACAKAGVKHIIYSTLEDFGGDKVVPFFTTKAKGTCGRESGAIT